MQARGDRPTPARRVCRQRLRYPDTPTPAGIANPASDFCVEQGGTVEIVDESGGQVGYCNLPDGTRFEEWEYFRSQSSTTPD